MATKTKKPKKVAYIKSNAAAWKYIEKIDFDSIRYKIETANPDWSKRHVDLSILSYKMFLYICRVYPEWSHAPHPSMDEAWHAHILHTKQYTKDTQAILGRFMHHAPASPPKKKSKTEKKSLQDAYSNTRRQFVLTFGPKADPEVLFARVSPRRKKKKAKKAKK